MTKETKAEDEGTIASVKNIVTTLLALVRTRLELLSTDLEEGWIRLVLLLATAFVALFCLCFGLVLMAIFIIVLLWDTNRLLVLGLFTAIFISAGLVLFAIAIRTLKTMPRLFKTSINELAKDQNQLGDNNNNPVP